MDKRQNSDINIILVGLDYFYALEVGQMLADQLEMYFLDSQGLLEFDNKPKTLDDIINEFGIEYYKKAQSGTIKYVSSFNSSVLAVESGAVLNKENLDRLDKYGLIVYIRQSEETLKNLYAKRQNLSEAKQKIHILSPEDIKARDQIMMIESEILVEDEGEPIRCVSEILKGIKKFYGID